MDTPMEKLIQNVKEYLAHAHQHEVDVYDDTGLTITYELFIDLVEFQRATDEYGFAWLHFVDWSQLRPMDLDELIRQKFVKCELGLKDRTDGINEQFPLTPYRLTLRGEKILSNPKKYIQEV